MRRCLSRLSMPMSIPKSKRQNVSDMYVLDNDHDEVGRKKLVCVDANVVEVRLVPI